MKRLLLLFGCCAVAFGQFTSPIPTGQSGPNYQTYVNNNFAWLYTNKAATAHTHTGVYAPLSHVHVIADITDWPTTFLPSAPGASTLGGVKSGQCTTTTGKLMGYDTSGDRICESDQTGAGASHTQNTDTGTTQTTFQIDSGNTGPKLKNNSGVLEVRNAADSDYVDLKAKSLTVSDGSGSAGAIHFGQGTTATAGTTEVVLYGDSAITSYKMRLPAAAATGFILGTNTAGDVVQTFVGSSGSGSVCLTTSCVMTTPNLGIPSAINLTNATSPPTWNQNTSGNAATATSLAANGTNCSAGNYPLGVDASGAVESCTAAVTASTSDAFTNKTLDAEGTGNVITVPFTIWLPGAGCSSTTAASFWDLSTSTPAVATCVTGTFTQKGMLAFADTPGGIAAQTEYLLPADWTGNIDAKIIWSTSANSGNAKWSLSTICTAVNATETDDASFNTASTVTTAAPGTANRLQTSAITSLTATGCAAGEFMHLQLFRDGSDGSDTLSATANFIGLELKIRRAM